MDKLTEEILDYLEHLIELRERARVAGLTTAAALLDEIRVRLVVGTLRSAAALYRAGKFEIEEPGRHGIVLQPPPGEAA